MSLVEVARLAGVSTDTVSRAINRDPRVPADTAAMVRQVAAGLRVPPVRRRVETLRSPRATSVAFLVLGASGCRTVPAFEQLLHGVSAAASDHRVNLSFGFVADPSELPAHVRERRVDGLLLHGLEPAPQTRPLRKQLESLPTVWLMANPQRPAWGDQVMQDNSVAGELAADYLLRRGHRRLAYLSIRSDSWGFRVRSLAFAHAAAERGAAVCRIEGEVSASADYWNPEGALPAIHELVDRLLAMEPRPTGLFVVEDRQLVGIHAALAARGVSVGPLPDGDFEVVSCNNERPYLLGIHPVPASIDLRAEVIGRRGVEQLLWRMDRGARVTERIRLMIEPVLVEHEGGAPPVVDGARRNGSGSHDKSSNGHASHGRLSV